jgi:hypothetical protein
MIKAILIENYRRSRKKDGKNTTKRQKTTSVCDMARAIYSILVPYKEFITRYINLIERVAALIRHIGGG